ncbi:hypothetical protein BOVA604_2925 [Bacteroides ovatus]|nr:hypothetical protein BOVA604_2925 [Bacteroides ovatus]
MISQSHFENWKVSFSTLLFVVQNICGLLPTDNMGNEMLPPDLFLFTEHNNQK